jgi:hypothetical protein
MPVSIPRPPFEQDARSPLFQHVAGLHGVKSPTMAYYINEFFRFYDQPRDSVIALISFSFSASGFSASKGPEYVRDRTYVRVILP